VEQIVIIRKDQMAALGAAQHRDYVRRMSHYLAVTVPDSLLGLSSDSILERIEATFQRAAPYGFRSERNVSIFVELAFRHGDEFDLSAAFAPVLILLRHPAGPPDAKADLLWRHHLKLLAAADNGPSTKPGLPT
jgi:hypothetical protein